MFFLFCILNKFSVKGIEILRCTKLINVSDNIDVKVVSSLTTKEQTTKFSSANFQKMLSPSYIIRLKGKQCGSR